MLLLTVVVLAVIILSDLRYWQRLFTFSRTDTVAVADWYAPTDTVIGNEQEIPGAGTGQGSLAESALQAAIDYAGSQDSVALLVFHNGALQLEHYWPGYDRETVVATASMHKTVLGLLIGAAIADGHIASLDELASSYLAEWATDARSEISIRHLLQMSSGLELVPITFNPFGKAMQLFLGTGVGETVLSIPGEQTPGVQFDYSSVNAQLLGLIVERATGHRYAQYLGKRLWSRIGAPTAHVWLDRPEGLARTFCCLLTTARGWVQVGRLFLNRGVAGGEQIVPADWIAASLEPSPAGPNYGFQIWRGSPHIAERRYNRATTMTIPHSQPYLADDVFFLDGSGAQRVYIVPSAGLVIVRTGQARFDWDDAVLPNLILAGIE